MRTRTVPMRIDLPPKSLPGSAGVLADSFRSEGHNPHACPDSYPFASRFNSWICPAW
jgi:hypothetical protein